MKFVGEDFLQYPGVFSMIDPASSIPVWKIPIHSITAVINGTDDGQLPLCTEREISSRMLPDNLFHPGIFDWAPPEYHDTILFVVAIICLIYSSEIGVMQPHQIVNLLYDIFDNNCYFQ